MSTIKVDTIQTSAGAGQYTAKAWSAWNQTGTQSILGSDNISSISDGGTGLTTNNFSNLLSSSNYAVGCGAGSSSTDAYRYLGVFVTMTTSSVKTHTLYSGVTANDAQYNSIQITL